MRDTDYTYRFLSGMNITTMWDAGLMYDARGAAMGAKFRWKGVNVVLGPRMNLARNWEGAGWFLAGAHIVNNILDIQSEG